VAGGWAKVDPRLRFAMTFSSQATGVDVETYHPLAAAGPKADPTPRDREFLAGITLTLWLFEDLDEWARRFRRPIWPMRLGRSQDLAAACTRRVSLEHGPGRQGTALLPWKSGIGLPGMRLQLPTAISLDRARTRWGSYLHHAAGGGACVDMPEALCDADGRAVVPLTPVHPDTVSGSAV
jgi:CRISPR-associated protein Cas5t